MGRGYFFEPTVLSPVPANADLLREEIFGPVAPIVTFETEQEAVAAANATEYGLVAYAYTSDLDRAVRVAEGIKAGMVGSQSGGRVEPRGPVRRGQAVRVSGGKAGARGSRSTWTSSTSPSGRASSSPITPFHRS